jgi:hypothetical protein
VHLVGPIILIYYDSRSTKTLSLSTCVKCYGAGILNALLNRVGDLAVLMVIAGMLVLIVGILFVI